MNNKAITASTFRASVLAAAFIAAAVSAAAATAPDQSAPSLLSLASQTLNRASAVSADFEEIDSYPGPYRDLAQRGHVDLARPGRLRVDIQRFRRVDSAHAWVPSGNDAVSVSDGETYQYAFLHPHSTQTRQLASSDSVENNALAPVLPLRDFIGGAAFASDSARLLPDKTWEGARYSVVNVEYATDGGQSRSVDVYVGSDHLLHRVVETVFTLGGAVTKEWTLRNVVLDKPVDPKRFTYAPPPDATPLARPRRSAFLEVGSDAPDFTVTSAAGTTLKLSDYRGKTVVLDFWATWCWPCNQSMPHTESVAEKFAADDVAVIAVAIWDSKTGFDSWIEKHNYPRIKFAFDPSPQGQDVASRLYRVTSTPTAIVIGPDGKVVKTIEGYTGPSTDLASAIASVRKAVAVSN